MSSEAAAPVLSRVRGLGRCVASCLDCYELPKFPGRACAPSQLSFCKPDTRAGATLCHVPTPPCGPGFGCSQTNSLTSGRLISKCFGLYL